MQLQGICTVCEESVGASIVIAGVGGPATDGHVAWEPVEGRQLDSPKSLVPSSPNYL